MDGKIATSVEAVEESILPRLREIYLDPDRPYTSAIELPAAMKRPIGDKSAARWAYERLILYIKNFEDRLDGEHEVGMGFAGGEAGVIKIEGIGYFDPDLLTFYGADPDGNRTQLIQHVSRLSVTLRATPKGGDTDTPRRIGFHLVRELESLPDVASDPDSDTKA